MVEENKLRNEKLAQPYNQHTGEGCNGERVLLEIKDAPFPKMYIPKMMLQEPIIKHLVKYGSMAEVLLKASKVSVTQELWTQFWLEFCQLRFSYDFEFYAIMCVMIQDKSTAQDIYFSINPGQRKLLSGLEKMRLSGAPYSCNTSQGEAVGWIHANSNLHELDPGHSHKKLEFSYMRTYKR